MKTTYTSKDQNWQDGSTIYWFTLTGRDNGTGKEFDGDVFGVVESGPTSTIVDCDGCPITVGDGLHIAVSRHAVVTYAMRAE